MGMAHKNEGAGFLHVLAVAASLYSGESSIGVGGLELGLWAETCCSHGGGRGEMRFLQKIKYLPNVIFMLETFRYVLSHVKYKISAKHSTGKATVFEVQRIFR